MSLQGFFWPPYAYVPGRNERHAEDLFDTLKNSVSDKLSPDELAQTAAFQGGLLYLDKGFYWEAHELFEPVWMACPANSRDRHLVQALIQYANANLKVKMVRPRAAGRLCKIVLKHLDGAGTGRDGLILGQSVPAFRRHVESLEFKIHNMQYSTQNQSS